MTGLKTSIAFQTDKKPADYISLAKLVNNYDFDIVSVYCDAPYHPSYGPLLIMAPHLKRAHIGPAAVSPFRMHPIDIAANTALLASLVNERVYLGLVRGAWLDDYGIVEPEKPIKGIREAVAIVRKLLSGQSAGFRGDVFQIASHVRAPYPLPEKEIPVMIGTWGPKMAEMAGEIADEVKIGGSANPVIAKRVLEFIKRGAEKNGRLSQDVGIAMGAVTVVDEDRILARTLAKRQLSLYLPVVAKLDPTVSLELEFINRVKRAVEVEDFRTAEKIIPDSILEKFAFAGDEKDIIRKSEAIYEAGITRIEFGTPHGLRPETGIRLLGEKVIPWLQHHLA
jgi:5,10-methylenetetrahydromethanopterin reductase